MTSYCHYHQDEHDSFQWRSYFEQGEFVTVCIEGQGSAPVTTTAMVFSPKESRKRHWAEIKNRITTHEGEVLSGQKAQSYAQKYGKQYLGVEYSRPNFDRPEYQKELEKTK